MTERKCEGLTREKFMQLFRDMWNRKEQPPCFVLGKNGIKALEEIFKKK